MESKSSLQGTRTRSATLRLAGQLRRFEDELNKTLAHHAVSHAICLKTKHCWEAQERHSSGSYPNAIELHNVLDWSGKYYAVGRRKEELRFSSVRADLYSTAFFISQNTSTKSSRHKPNQELPS